MRLCQPDVATSAYIEGSHALRNCPFNARSNGIALFELPRLLPLACRLNGLKLRLRTYHQLTRIGAGCGTLTAAGTDQTILFAKLDANHLGDGSILLERPLATDLSLGTGRLLGLPIDGKPRVIKALTCMRLPTGAAGDRPSSSTP